MKYLALAVLLVVMQASPPVPRQPLTLIEPISSTPDQQNSHTPTPDNTKQPIVVSELPAVSVTKDRLDKLYIFFTGVLIVVGILGVTAAYRTLKAMEQQVGEMKAQREAMQGQLTTMQSQLAGMDAAGKQTDKLIEHASDQVSALRQAAGAMQDSAEAGKMEAISSLKAAEAAKKSADALINSERAWILIKVHHQMDGGDEFALTRSNGPDTQFCGEIVLTNEGRSPCWITDVRLKFEIVESLPKIPDFASQPTQEGCVGMSLGTKNGNYSLFWMPSFRGVESDAMMTVVYGIVKYRDIFGENRATTFGLKVVRDRFTNIGKLERLTEYPEYNKSA